MRQDSLFDPLWGSLLHVRPLDRLHVPPGAARRSEGTSRAASHAASGADADADADDEAARAPPLAARRVAQPHEASAGLPQRWGHLRDHARRLEIFLDHLASAVESRQCRVLLNPKYEPLLSPRSLALSQALRDFLATLPADAKHAGPFQPILTLLLRMGLRTDTLRDLLGVSTPP